MDGFRFMEVNAAFTAALRWRQEDMVGRAEAELWGQEGLPETLERRVREDSHVRNLDVRLRTKSGSAGLGVVSTSRP